MSNSSNDLNAFTGEVMAPSDWDLKDYSRVNASVHRPLTSFNGDVLILCVLQIL